MNIETANKLVELRKKHGLSQEELADKLGVSRQAVSKWERSEASPDTDNLIELAKLYDISLDELLLNKENNAESGNEKVEAEVVDNKKSTVHISRDGLYIHDGNSTVEIKPGKIHIVDDDDGDDDDDDDDDDDETENEKLDIDINGKKFDKDCCKREVARWANYGKIQGIISSLCWVSATIAYLLMGFFLDSGWAIGWNVFFAPILISSLIDAIAFRNPNRFCYPVLAVNVFCVLGMIFHIWHPLWVIFLTIPLFYAACSLIRHISKR